MQSAEMLDGRKQGDPVCLDTRIHIMNDDGEIISNLQLTNDSPSIVPPPHHLHHSNSKQQQEFKIDDSWLPITQSRRGNSLTATFHLLSSGIGTQTLSLPLAFVYLGWFWGSLCLSVAFVWQLYTIGLLVSLHEESSSSSSVPAAGTRRRISRYLQLSIAAFGVKLGKVFAIFPVMYLSGGTCVMFIITGGGTMKLFYQLLCGDTCSNKHPLTTTEWFLVFVCIAILVSLFCPNLHSVALVSFLGAIMAVGYCTMLWVVFLAKGKADGVVYDPSETVESEAGRVRSIFTALGIIAVAFRGHNVVLEIQGTMPWTPNRASSKFMWKGVVASYLIIAMCFFPLAIVGYWTFGNKFPTSGGILVALISNTLNYHTSKPLLGLIYMQIIISCVTAFQIYSMVVYDNLERAYISKARHECPQLVRRGIRIFFGGLTFFISVAFPFLPSLALIIGGISLHVTFGYPCLMWIAIKRPPMKSVKWWVNLGLGCLGTGLSVLVVVGGVWNLACRGLDANFFHPR